MKKGYTREEIKELQEKIKRNKENIIRMYSKEKRSFEAIAREYEVSFWTIWKYLREVWKIPPNQVRKVRKVEDQPRRITERKNFFQRISPKLRERIRMNTEINRRYIKNYAGVSLYDDLDLETELIKNIL